MTAPSTTRVTPDGTAPDGTPVYRLPVLQVESSSPPFLTKEAAAFLATAGTALGAYHGYMRTRSVGWAIGWAVLGGLFPIVTIPVAIAQGFGKRET